MSKNANFPKDLKRFIAESAISLKGRKREWVAATIQAEILEGIAYNEKWYVPARETLLTEISRAWNHPGTERDKEWCIGVSQDFGIPPEANSALSQLWLLHKIEGSKFPIRQAQWAARLRFLPSTQTPEALFYWSNRYAVREQVSEMLNLNRENDTSDLDSHVLEISPIVQMIGIKTGVWPDPGEIVHPNEREKSTVDWLVRGYHPDFVAERDLGFGPAEVVAIDLDLEGKEMYALWLRHLSRGPKWGETPHESKTAIASRLRQQVAVQQQQQLLLQVPGPLAPYMALVLWKPTELLKEVGYEE